MALVMPARFASPEVRTGFYYTAMFLPAGVSTLLMPIWLDSKGITPEQIGIISATPIFIMIVLNMVVGRIADKARDWRSVIIAGSLISGVVSFGFILVDEFWGILIFSILCVIPIMAIEPVIDAAAIRMTRRRGSDFALVRIWGSIGYIVMTALTGVVFGWVGIAVFVPLFIATSLLRGFAALPLPLFRAPEGEVAPAPNPELAGSMREVFRPWFVLTLTGTAMLQASHMLLISFGTLLWLRAGVNEAMIGVLWTIAPICELVTMFFFARLARRFSARHLLLAACLCGAVRWTGVAVSTEFWQLAILQILHMATFGLAYMGIVNFIANWTSEEIAAQAQSFYMVLRQVASVLALLAFGPLVAAFGMNAFYAAAVISGLGGTLILVSLGIMRTKR